MADFSASAGKMESRTPSLRAKAMERVAELKGEAHRAQVAAEYLAEDQRQSERHQQREPTAVTGTRRHYVAPRWHKRDH